MGCFALRKGKCSILNVKKCDESSCGFYKTDAQFKEDRQKAFDRIKSLDKEDQLKIAGDYYGGKMPWLKEEI